MNKKEEKKSVKLLKKIITNTEWFKQFDEYQQEEIKKGIENKVNFLEYAKREYNVYQMFQLRLGLEENLETSWYANNNFDYVQME